MIWVVAGTRDARQLVDEIWRAGLPVIASVVSEYGAQLLQEAFSGKVPVRQGAMELSAMRAFVREKGIIAVIDATHPFARAVSENLLQLAAREGVAYLRYERPSVDTTDFLNLIVVRNWEEVLGALGEAGEGETVFLATGSRALPQVIPPLLQKKLRPIARILPDLDSLRLCLDLGLQADQIIAMQGPFSEEMNRAMFAQTKARWLVTKESGAVGGAAAKLRAAAEMGLKTILLCRPDLPYPCITTDFEQAVAWAEERLQ
ncbi:precorrin-6x reductase cbij [Heliomicrobium modesticaldum Ice1]|uniref:Precorrin-6x reductase cbij n=1 Tax=Heliobacterium modesticaldum (strain ATCC 51547 / Ice1) TaxID=498761 RepID=B0TIK1_HELMI|nr:precorrin-6A reductase [Heliomicrobium modesticaldum]ABZ84942.1 precorrin-6x reductase cbij [Heliomicrobium modesticaldum Ice1]